MVHDPNAHFLAVAEEQDLALAALPCKASRRAIISSLSLLEDKHGTVLCNFDSGRVSLTRAGEHLRRSLLPAQTETAHVSSVTIMRDLMSDNGFSRQIAARARQISSRINIRLLKGPVSRQLIHLEARSVDIAMMHGWPRVDRSRLTAIPFYEEELAIFIAEDNFDGTSTPVALASLCNERWTIPSSLVMPAITDLLVWESLKAGFVAQLIPVLTLGDFIDRIRLRKEIGFAPRSFIDASSLELIALPLEPKITIPFGCVYRAGEQSLAVRRTLDLMWSVTESHCAKAANTLGPHDITAQTFQGCVAPIRTAKEEQCT